MKINQLKAGAVLSYLSMGLGFIISIIYTPIMLRLLGQSQYGLYTLVASVVSYLGLLNFGFGSAYMRYYYRYKVEDDHNGVAKLNGMFLIVFSLLGLIAVVAGMLLVSNIDFILGNNLTASELDTARILMMILVINLAISFPGTVFSAYITANEKFVYQKIIQLITVVVNPLVMLPVLLLGYQSVGMVVVTTLLSLIVQVSNVIFCFRTLHIQFIFRNFDFGLFKEMVVFSSYIFMNMIVDQINWNVDKFIVGRYRGTAEVAIYGLAAQLNSYYLMLSTAISSVFIPRVNHMVAAVNDNQALTDLFTRIGRIQFMLLSLVWTGLVFFGAPFIYMWAGADYLGSYPIALLLIIPVTIPLIQNLGIEIQRAKDMHKFRTVVYLLIAVGNILVSIPLTAKYGGIGAAFGTACALIIGNGLVMNWYYDKKVGLDIKYFWAQINRFIPSLLIPIVTGIIMFISVDLFKLESFILCGFIYVLFFCLSMWFFGMNQYEKDLLGKPAAMVFQKVKKSLVLLGTKH
ncbi:Polysaccharide biosynthesis protein [anaerobic digester metagenome]